MVPNTEQHERSNAEEKLYLPLHTIRRVNGFYSKFDSTPNFVQQNFMSNNKNIQLKVFNTPIKQFISRNM